MAGRRRPGSLREGQDEGMAVHGMVRSYQGRERIAISLESYSFGHRS